MFRILDYFVNRRIAKRFMNFFIKHYENYYEIKDSNLCGKNIKRYKYYDINEKLHYEVDYHNYMKSNLFFIISARKNSRFQYTLAVKLDTPELKRIGKKLDNVLKIERRKKLEKLI
jgi:hypothetical protein